MMVIRSILFAVLAFCCGHAAHSQTGPSIGPADISHFKQLQKKLGASDNMDSSYFSNSDYNTAINILVEGLLSHEGSKFCLPEQFGSFPVGRVFVEIATMVPSNIRKTQEHEALFSSMLSDLKIKFPCKKT